MPVESGLPAIHHAGSGRHTRRRYSAYGDYKIQTSCNPLAAALQLLSAAAACLLLLSNTHGATTAAGGLGVLAPHAQAPVVAQTAVVPAGRAAAVVVRAGQQQSGWHWWQALAEHGIMPVALDLHATLSHTAVWNASLCSADSPVSGRMLTFLTASSPALAAESPSYCGMICCAAVRRLARACAGLP